MYKRTMDEDRDKSPEDSIPLADDDPQGIWFESVHLSCTIDYLYLNYNCSHYP